MSFGLLTVAILALFFAPALDGTFIFRDAFNLFYPYKAVEAEYLRNFEVCLWNPWETMGSSFVGELATSWFYPANVLFMVLPVEPAFRLFIVLHYLLAAGFMWLLLSDLKLAPPARAAGALAYTLSGFMLSQNGLPDMLATGAWLPGALWMLNRHLRGQGLHWLLALGAALAMPLLAGRAEGVIILGVAVAAWIVISPEAGPGAARRAVKLATILPAAGLIALGVGMVQFLPSLELGRLSMKGEGFPLEVAQLWSFHPKRLLEFLLPHPFGTFWPVANYSAADLTGWAGYYPFTVTEYMGFTTLALAGLALVKTSWRNRILVGGTLVLIVLFSMGRHSPLYGLAHQLLPLLRAFRYPEKYMLLAVFIIALAGASGMNGLITRPGRGRRAQAVLAAALLAILALDLFHANRWIIPYASPEIYAAAPDVLAELRRHDRKAGLDLFGPDGRPRPGDFRIMRDLGQPPKSAIYLMEGKNDLEKLRRWERETMKPNFNFIFGLEELTGYTAAATADFNQLMKSHLNLKTLELFNVRFVIAPSSGSALEGRGLPVRAVRHHLGYQIFELPGFFPRAYLVGRSERVPWPMDRLDLIAGHDFRRSAVLEDSPGLPPVSEESDLELTPAEIVSYEPERVVVRTSAEVPAYLVLSDSWFPGWEAEVDGKPTEIFKANYLVRAVRLPAGKHEVRISYRPRPYRWGLMVSIATSLLVLGLGVVSTVHSRRRGEDCPGPPDCGR